jgi:hypothetical protein
MGFIWYKIKDFSFKFYVDNKKAQVLIDIEHRSEKRNAYFEKIEALKTHFRICKDLVFEKTTCSEMAKQ